YPLTHTLTHTHTHTHTHTLFTHHTHTHAPHSHTTHSHTHHSHISHPLTHTRTTPQTFSLSPPQMEFEVCQEGAGGGAEEAADTRHDSPVADVGGVSTGLLEQLAYKLLPRGAELPGRRRQTLARARWC